MKRLIFLFIILGVALALFSNAQFRIAVTNGFQGSACDIPLPYKIGLVDSRFNLSSQDVSSDITEATSLWSQSEGKNLFVEDPKAELTVNFVYDQRQALTSQIQTMQESLDAKNNNLQAEIQSYYSDVNTFKQKLQDFNSEVDSWNSKGGAPPDVYTSLNQKQKDLQAEGEQLNQRAKQLNLSTNAYNTDVGTLNQDVKQFNAEIAQKPEEGLYNGQDNTITMYFASNKDELVHTLAHEFGHAIGMEHEDDPDAIMYAYTTKKISLTQADLSQLQYICRKQSSFLLWFRAFSLWLNQKLITLKKN